MAFDRDKSKNRKRRKVCQFCVDKCTYIDYKDTAKLRRFLSERSKILPVADCHMEQWSQLVHHRDKVLTPQIRAMVSCIAQVENIPLHLED